MPKALRLLGSIQVSTRSHLLDRRARTATATSIGLAQIGHTHRYAATSFAAMLADAQALLQAATYAGRLTPAKEAAVQRLTRAYLHALLTLTNDVGIAIQKTLGQPGLLNQIGAAERRRIDQLAADYVHHVRDILRRSYDEKGR